jgi:predicted metal-dependent phosphoesterase TrpH
VEAGLDGMETAYAKYSPETTAMAMAIAAEFGLKNSGGSDFHGSNKPDIAIGKGRGDLAIPHEWLTDLHGCLK